MKKLLVIEDRPVLVHYKEIEINGNPVMTPGEIEVLENTPFSMSKTLTDGLSASEEAQTLKGTTP
jgi:hypothetical protein